MIIDVITYNGEKELFDLRYNILKDYVDEFRVFSFYETFSGKPREDDSWFDVPEYPKVRHFIGDKKSYEKYEDLAKSSPNTEYGKGARHWITEFCQKESIKDCLLDVPKDAILFIGDCDEIWDDEGIANQVWPLAPIKLKLRVYSYYLNNRSSENFWGTLRCRYEDIKDEVLNHVRANAIRSSRYAGWHFTSMGGHERVKQKLTDSYTKDSYATDQVLDNLQQNISNNKDFLGRDFTYTIDESDWPQYLKDNKDKYKHLCQN